MSKLGQRSRKPLAIAGSSSQVTLMDYKQLGLKVGLEIHQQLASRYKLFCGCPIIKSEEFGIEVKRKLRAVAGEMGEYDPAALYEFLRGRVFNYKLNRESSCLVELDDDPPREINQEALTTALQICKLVNCEIPAEVYVMRKTVIDGSSVSGFQRTALVGMNGSIDTSFGTVAIATVCLEEDSAPAITKEASIVEYRLDRLGTPLVEISTEADMHSPQEAKEAAERLGLLLRSVNVVRGIGSIRQDVNVSIEGGERIEIKGFQELERIPELIENETKRQLALLQIKDELHRRGLIAFKPPRDVTHIFRNTKNNFLRKIISDNEKILAMLLPNFSGLLKLQCGDRTFGKELDSYARAYGYGIIHSDEDLGKYDLTREFVQLRKELAAEERDVIVITAGKNPDKAANAVLDRARHCLLGIPKETRVADSLGSRYTRPLPGSERMYPETDVPPVDVAKLVAAIKLPKTLFEKEKELAKIMPQHLASQLIHSPDLAVFEEVVGKTKADPVLVATTLLSTIKDLRRKSVATENVSTKDIISLFMLIKNNRIAKEALPDALTMLADGKKLEEIEQRFASVSDADFRRIIASIVKENKGKPESMLMGLAMQQLRGRVPGEKVLHALREEMK